LYYFVDLDYRECLTDIRGSNYTGTRNVTTNGKPCIKWAAWYNDDNKILSYGSSAANSSNYCRNVKQSVRGTTSQPWCFTEDSRSIFGSHYAYCEIPQCCKCIVLN